MKQPNDTTHKGLVAPYNQIPDYDESLALPDDITVLYTRLSKDDKEKDKEDDSNSIVNQKKILAKYAQDNRLSHPFFFTDDGISGTTFERPDFQAAIALVEAGRVKNFVVKDMSRFGRDYLKVGFYTEVMFSDMGVRFVAINDAVDSSLGDNDLVPFRNLFNEWYARDTSKKVRSVARARGMAGEPLAANPPFGYLKDPKNKKKWVLDEAAAEVVRQIFAYCMDGLGPGHIATRLKEAKIETPTAHWHSLGLKTNKQPPLDPYDWEATTVMTILSRREYLGHTVNFKTHRKSYKSKKVLINDLSEQVVFENTHPAITEQEVFDRVQQIRSNKRRHNSSGRVGLFSGLTYCADCGSKMYLSSGASKTPDQDNYVCSGFRSKKVQCDSSHYIRMMVLEKMVLEDIRRVTSFAAQNEAEFVAMLQAEGAVKGQKELAAAKRNLSKAQSRLMEIDTIIRKMYEDKVFEKLTDERFATLSQGYEREQKALQSQVESLMRQIADQERQSLNVSGFLNQVRKYTEAQDLTPTLLHELVQRVEVHATDKSSGERRQDITVHYNFVGVIGKLDISKAKTLPQSAQTLHAGN